MSQVVKILDDARANVSELSRVYQYRVISLLQTRTGVGSDDDRRRAATLLLPRLIAVANSEMEDGRFHRAVGLLERAVILADQRKIDAGPDLAGLLVDAKKKESESRKTSDAIGVLTATQKEAMVTLPTRPAPYVIRGKYYVPEGSTLQVEEGNTVLVEPGGELSIAGKLLVGGIRNRRCCSKPPREAEAGSESRSKTVRAHNRPAHGSAMHRSTST